MLIEDNMATFNIDGNLFYRSALGNKDKANSGKVGFTSVNGLGSSVISNFIHAGQQPPFTVTAN